jgi:hypothetical protein
MNILVAKNAYDQGKKIRHNSWAKDYWCSKIRNTVSLGIVDSLCGHFFDWLSIYAEGWEIYKKYLPFKVMEVGQNFIFNDNIYKKMRSFPGDKGNVVSINDNRIVWFMEEDVAYELVEEPINVG